MTRPIIHYAIWPEGMPAAARFTTSPARAFLLQNVMGLALLMPFSPGRRIRTASQPTSRPDPFELDTTFAAAG